MKMMKVFNPDDMGDELNETLLMFGGECHELPNGCYFSWSIKHEDGLGYIEESVVEKINQWMKDDGAEEGETVLIERSW